MRADRYRLPLAVGVAVVAAGAATLLLRPRGGVLEPAAVEVAAYFSPDDLQRAEDYRGPQRLIGLGSLALTGGALVLMAIRPPAPVRRALERASRRPYAGGAAAGAGISLVLVAVTLPLAAVAHDRARGVGLSTQDWLPWLGDTAKAAGIGALMAAGGAAIGLALLRRFPRHWWASASVALVALSAAFVYASPVVIEPLFNRFEPLPQGELRGDVVALAQRAGVDVGEVYRVDASRRTTGANAYVGGLGATKRVVLYDNLIERFPPEEVRSVVAHELAHVKHRDVPRGLLWLAIVAPPGLFLVKTAGERFGLLPSGRGQATATALPALALALGLVSFAGGIASNVLSRQVEARADAFALKLTDDPAAHIGLERRLSRQNISDPDPPDVLHRLFGTHPKTVDRIGYGLTYARGQ